MSKGHYNMSRELIPGKLYRLTCEFGVAKKNSIVMYIGTEPETNKKHKKYAPKKFIFLHDSTLLKTTMHPNEESCLTFLEGPLT